MKLKAVICMMLTIMLSKEVSCQVCQMKSASSGTDHIQALKDTLSSLALRSDNELYTLHCNSMISVIESKEMLTRQDSVFLENTYNAFNDLSDTANPRMITTYLKRQRSFILSWISPTDGVVSFSWLKPPKDWNPETRYPLYIELHGLWSVASNSIEYLTYPYLHSASDNPSFEDGYLLSPWGRGNLWYQGISETDIWECIASLEEIVHVDPARKYLCGHSMGGFGAWSIGIKSPGTWAALGIHAGALWYDQDLVTNDVAQVLKDVPTYFVCGTSDGLLGINQTAYNLLADAGNPNLQFVTFPGGHEYIEENVVNMYLWMRNFINEDAVSNGNKAVSSSARGLDILCYPNPVKEAIHIWYTGAENSCIKISLYDRYGRLINEIIYPARIPGTDNITINVSGMTRGVYFIRAQSGDQVTVSKIIVIK